MTPLEAAQLAEVRSELARACDKLDTLHRIVLAQSVLGVRSWVPMAVAVLALAVSVGACVRVEARAARDAAPPLGGLYP